MQIVVEGEKNGERMRITWDLFDRYDPQTKVHSMARTTGYTATVVARLLAGGRFSQKGVIAPETIAADPSCMDFILKGLAERGVVYKESVERI
jgi:saccharopine dehydrogenase-like NADP-dependent oxidoreductase